MTFKFGWELMPGKLIKTETRRATVCSEATIQEKDVEEKIYDREIHGSWIRATRKESRLGLREAARRLDMSAATLTKIETGELIFTSADGFGRALKILDAHDAPRGAGR